MIAIPSPPPLGLPKPVLRPRGHSASSVMFPPSSRDHNVCSAVKRLEGWRRTVQTPSRRLHVHDRLLPAEITTALGSGGRVLGLGATCVEQILLDRSTMRFVSTGSPPASKHAVASASQFAIPRSALELTTTPCSFLPFPRCFRTKHGTSL
jgi:hypothetical protein